jgi:catechol 2,3-dioxygenase-like lactoylglutathione lyase family enzyme
VATLERTPKNATHWSRASMAAESGLSESTVGRIWKAFDLKPHQVDTFKLFDVGADLASDPASILGDMTIQRMDNVGIVVDDLDAAVAFFTELGMELEGRMPIEGSWAGNVVGLDDMRSEIAMMRIPDAPGRLELAKYHTPKAITPKPEITPANTLGLHRVMFAVDDIEDTLARLRPHGAELVGEVTRYEDSYLLCYLRGPSGIILALAEQLS